MFFWNETFMEKMRNEWMSHIHKVQYNTEGVWNTAEITEKKIVGNGLSLTVRLPNVFENVATVTGIRIIDIDGTECGYQKLEIVRTNKQSLVMRLDFPLYEKGDE